MATWDRDRLGYLEMFRPRARSECITCPIRTDGNAKLSVNAEILSPQASLEIELLDEGFRPIPGFSGKDRAHVTESGLDVGLLWPHGPALPISPAPVRLRLSFAGLRPEDIRLYACYISAI